jgi:hypothetical protein
VDLKGVAKKQKSHIIERGRAMQYEQALVIIFGNNLDKSEAPYISGKRVWWLPSLNRWMYHWLLEGKASLVAALP